MMRNIENNREGKSDNYDDQVYPYLQSMFSSAVDMAISIND